MNLNTLPTVASQTFDLGAGDRDDNILDTTTVVTPDQAHAATRVVRAMAPDADLLLDMLGLRP